MSTPQPPPLPRMLVIGGSLDGQRIQPEHHAWQAPILQPISARLDEPPEFLPYRLESYTVRRLPHNFYVSALREIDEAGMLHRLLNRYENPPFSQRDYEAEIQRLQHLNAQLAQRIYELCQGLRTAYRNLPDDQLVTLATHAPESPPS